MKYDPGAASKELNDGAHRLPLHLACTYNTNISSTQDLYDAYPDAILARNRDGRTPLDLAEGQGTQPVMEFLQTQLVYARQVQDMIAMATGDENGWLCS